MTPLPSTWSTEPVIGWRMWGLRRTRGGALVLEPAVLAGMTSPWEARLRARAICAVESSSHRAPDPGCTCGLYAFQRVPFDLLAGVNTLERGGPTVLGTVAMWGRVIEHEAGYRAELAYPQRLRLVCAPCFSEGRHAPSPVVWKHRGSLTALCESHRSLASRLRVQPAPGSTAELERELLDTYGVELQPLPGTFAVRPSVKPVTPPAATPPAATPQRKRRERLVDEQTVCVALAVWMFIPAAVTWLGPLGVLGVVASICLIRVIFWLTGPLIPDRTGARHHGS